MKILFALSIWLLTVLGAYWLGLDREDTHSKESSSNPAESITQQVGSEQVTKLKESSEIMPINQNRLGSSLIQTDDFAKKEVLSNQAKKSSGNLDSSHPVERLQAFVELLKKPNFESVQTARKAYESLPGGTGRFSELKILAFAWGQVDPEAALAWSNKQEHWDKHIANGSIMDSWARKDADSAIAWARENFEGKENPYFIGIINGLSETDLPKATDLMTDLPFGRVRGRSVHMLFEKVWNEGEDVAMHWAEHLPEGSLQNFAYGELGEKVARSDMPRAIEWIESMNESSLKLSVTEKVTKEMARRNPVETANWINSLPNDKSKTAAMIQLAEIWTRQDPIATAEWINQLPASENTDPLIETLVVKVHRTDPEGAMTWAETISNPERRKHLVEKVEKVLRKQESTKKNTD